MRFGTQQAIALTVSIGCLSLPRIASLFPVGDITWDLPYVLQWTMTLLLNLAFFRYFFWLAWDSERGQRFFLAIHFPKEWIINGVGAGTLRWYCHINEHGDDLDAR